VHGWPAVLFGIPFLGVGVAVLLVGSGVIPVSPGSINGPMWMLQVVGVIFGLAGLALMGHGSRGIARNRRAARLAIQQPEQPWLGDYEWDPAGSPDRSGRLMTGLTMFLFMCLFGAIINWFAFMTRTPSCFLTGFAVVFDVILLAVLGGLIYYTLRHLKYGRSFVRFKPFPVHPGETLEAAFVCPRGIGQFNAIEFTLRCIAEKYELRGTGRDRSRRVVCYALHEDSYRLDEAGELTGESVPITFAVPEGLPMTALDARPARYWELQVHADTPGVDFDGRYLVPVYARPDREETS
jgi:hypothetical protein